MNTTKSDLQRVFLIAEWRLLAMLDCEVTALYGEDFSDLFNRPPAPAFLAEGPGIKLYPSVKLTT